MTYYTIRYRYAMLLLLVAITLVTNPVWHAIIHCHDNEIEVISFIEWTEKDLCVHCEAVSQFANTTPSKVSFVPVESYEEIERYVTPYLDLSPHLSIWLRAPPSLA